MKHRESSSVSIGTVIRRIVRGGMIVLVLALIIAIVWLASRYQANQRLEDLITSLRQDHYHLQQSPIEWDSSLRGCLPEWIDLDRWFGRHFMHCLLDTPKEFVFRWDHAPDDVMLKVLRESYGLSGISIEGGLVPKGTLELIATGQPRIESIHIRMGRSLSDDDALWLSRMKNLKNASIHIQTQTALQNNWSWLTKLPSLGLIDVSVTKPTEEEVKTLLAYRKIWALELNDAEISRDTLIKLCDLPSLDRLSLSGVKNPLDFPEGKRLPSSLKLLFLANTGEAIRSLSAIEGHPGLYYVSVVKSSLSDAAQTTLGRLPHLTNCSLTLIDTDPEWGLRSLFYSLCHSQNLQSLYIQGMNTHLSFPAGRQFGPKLKDVVLWGTDVNDDLLRGLDGLDGLENLSIREGNVTDAGLEVLGRLPKLEGVSLGGLSGVTDVGMKSLSLSSSLREVDVKGCSTTAQGLVYLNAIPNWERFEYDGLALNHVNKPTMTNLNSENVEEFLKETHRRQDGR